MGKKTDTNRYQENILTNGPSPLIPEKKRPQSIKAWIKSKKGSAQITRKDVVYIYRNIIFAKSFGELKQLMENEAERDKLPSLVVAVIAGVLGDVARGNIANISRMISYIFPIYEEVRWHNLVTDNSKEKTGYEKILEMEATLRKLEGDDAIQIIDKLMLEDMRVVSDV